MPRIEWNDGLKLGIREIDRQHEKLIALINGLYDAFTQGREKQVLDGIVSEAHDYIGYHFSTEQRLMEEHGYPGLDDHVDQHEDYILKSSDHLKASQDQAAGLAKDVLDYLTDWWKTHINGTDRKLAAFLKDRGVA
ncbi:bacteriohemerythrin [Desulfocurvus sp. DL9XJH121]